jgi:hypothetical protein
MPAAESLVHEAVHLERSRLAGAAGVAGAAGYALPLAAGLATGRVHDGAAVAAGALIVGYANLGGGRRARAQGMLATTLAAGAGALLGALAGPAAAVPLVAAWSFAAGLLVAFGTRAAFVGVLSTWALLLGGDPHLHGAGALRGAALIAAGGLVQTLIALALKPAPAQIGPAVRAGAVAHAARLAGALAVAVALYEACGLRFGYWLPLTVLLVLRPDRDGTVARVLERVLGTIAGVALASLFITVCHPSPAALVVLLAALAAAVFALYFASYTLSSLLLTVLIGLAAELGGGSAIGALGDRLVDTTAGAAIALAAVYVAGPRKFRSAVLPTGRGAGRKLSSSQPTTPEVNTGVLAGGGNTVKAKVVVTNPQKSVSNWYSRATIQEVVRKAATRASSAPSPTRATASCRCSTATPPASPGRCAAATRPPA